MPGNLLGELSETAIPKFSGIAWCFIDSDDHAPELINAELALLKPRIVVGGIIAFHDYGNYAGVEQAMRQFLNERNGDYHEMSVPWDVIRLECEHHHGEEGNNSWHCCHEPHPQHVAAIKRIR